MNDSIQRALIYCRVSSEKQKNEGHGLEGQEHRCREYARSKSYQVQEVFRDSFTGAGDFLNRPAMLALLNHIDNHPHTKYVVIFDDLSRFARDVVFHIKLRQALAARDARPECLNFNFDDSPEGQMVEVMMAAQNEYHRKNNRRQVIQKMKARVEKGYWPFYPPPGYMYKKDPVHGKVLVISEPNASFIRDAFEGYASNRFATLTEVVKFLRDAGYEGGPQGKPVYTEGVTRILRRVVYAGYIERPEWDVARRKAHHEGLISLEIYEQVQAKLNGKFRKKLRTNNRKEFVLRGFLLCSFCNETLTASWSRGRSGKMYRFFRCKTFTCVRFNKSTNADFIDREFDKLLRSVCPRASAIQLAQSVLLNCWKRRLSTFANQQQRLEKQLTESRKKVDMLSARIVNAMGEALIPIYEEQILKSRSEAELIQNQLKNLGTSAVSFETALGVVMSFLENPISIWEKDDINAKRLVLKLVFAEKLTFHPDLGFETAQKSKFLALFEQISVNDSQEVEVGGMIPRPNPALRGNLRRVVSIEVST